MIQSIHKSIIQSILTMWIPWMMEGYPSRTTSGWMVTMMEMEYSLVMVMVDLPVVRWINREHGVAETRRHWRTPPLRHSHVGSGGSSVETGSDHDGDTMDGDWERSTPGKSTRGTVLDTGLTDHGGSRVTLQSTGFKESPDLGDPAGPEQPRHGQLHG